MNLSLIIPLYNSNYIEKQLLSIRNLEKSNIILDIIFIDDWSEENYTIKYNKIFNDFINLDIKYYYLWNKNWRNRVSESRNIWSKLAKSNNLIFIDQETILEKKYLINISKYIDLDKVILWQSLWYNNLEKSLGEKDIDFFMGIWYINKDNFRDFRFDFYKEKQEKNRIWEFFWASNFFIKKEIFNKIWWFDYSLDSYWDEDVEFWYRLYRSWFEIIFDENLKVLNLSEKLYKFPYKFLEKNKINSLSQNWLKNYEKHKTYEYKKYILDRFNNLDLDFKQSINHNFSKNILNHNFYENWNKTIFFRIDDIKNMSENFLKLLNIFKIYNFPIILWIEPWNIDIKTIEFLNKFKNEYNFIDIVQHWLKHINYSDGKFDYEFWKNRNFDEQFKDIEEWYVFMNKNFWENFVKAFIPPYNNYDINTEKILWNIWFQIVSSGFPNYQYNQEISLIQIHFFLDIIKDYKLLEYKTFEEIILELNYFINKNNFCWIILHPQYFNEYNLKLLIKIMEYIKYKNFNMENFSTFLQKYSNE